MRTPVLQLVILLGALVGLAASSGSKFPAAPGCDQFHGERVLTTRQSLGAPIVNTSIVRSEPCGFVRMVIGEDVQGELSLQPDWKTMIERHAGALSHLVPDAANASIVGGPGTLTTVQYNALFPLSVLMNGEVMRAASGNPLQARPDILMIGLGLGSGLATLAHHFPEASITVVELDPEVIRMTLEYFPLVQWLSRVKRGERSVLTIEWFEGYKYVNNTAASSFDVVVFDSYLPPMRIPGAFLRPDFMAQIARILRPGGVFLANAASSVDAMARPSSQIGKLMRNALLANISHLQVFPILYPSMNEPKDGSAVNFDKVIRRGMVLLASASPLSAALAPESWRIVKAFTLYPELRPGDAIVGEVRLASRDKAGQAMMQTVRTPLSFLTPTLVDELRMQWRVQLDRPIPYDGHFYFAVDEKLAGKLRSAVLDHCKSSEKDAAAEADCPFGWKNATAKNGATGIFFEETDRVVVLRATWSSSIAASKELGTVSAETLTQADSTFTAELERARAKQEQQSSGAPQQSSSLDGLEDKSISREELDEYLAKRRAKAPRKPPGAGYPRSKPPGSAPRGPRPKTEL